MSSEMSIYERRSLAAIHDWKQPSTSLLEHIGSAINWPLGKAGDFVTKIPGVPWVIEKTIGGLISLLTDGASGTVRVEAILAEIRHGSGHARTLPDLASLDLAEIDSAIGYLGAKYKSIAVAEGTGTGLLGLPGIPVDLVALVGLNLRAIAEYATYCGFDVRLQEERLFMMTILGLASSPNDVAKQVTMAQLVKIAREVARKRGWKQLEKHAFVVLIKKIAQALGIRLTKAKLAQIVPFAGAVVGGGFNAYYTAKICNAAYFLYRERFLAAKYGADVILDV